MGIQKEPAAFVASLSLPNGFSVCELGDQGMCGDVKRLAKDWYLELGCGRYVSIDGNGRGTLTADLNQPIDEQLQSDRLCGSFDLVTDFGTGEHIFNQAQVWRTLHDLCKPGGYIAFDRPSTGYHAHCFYLIHECLIRDLAAANGYEIVWLERRPMARGELLGGCFKISMAPDDFVLPQQGRYRDSLVISCR